ncbi:hypothetical protein LXL04_017248 [Taraxacum kok-saghyz]
MRWQRRWKEAKQNATSMGAPAERDEWRKRAHIVRVRKRQRKTETIETEETLKEAYQAAVAEKMEKGRGKQNSNRRNSRKSVMEKTVETSRKKTECKEKATRDKKQIQQ